MVNHCSVLGCRNESFSGCNISFHRFPLKLEIRQKWNQVIPIDIKEYSVVCSDHFQNDDFAPTRSRKKLLPDAVPSIFPSPLNTAVPQHQKITSINTVINEAVTLAQSMQKTTAAPRPPLKVQPKAKPTPKVSTCRDFNETQRLTYFSIPRVIVDIPPSPSPPAVKTLKITLPPIPPPPPVVIEKAKPTNENAKQSRLQSRCKFLNKKLRALRERFRRRTATIEKLEAEKKVLTQQHLRTIELLKSGDKRDHDFEDVLREAVIKLS